VSSFTFLISSKNATKEVKCTDGKISQEGIEMLKNSNSGDMLTFADIKITDIGGTTRKISPMTIRLK
jgi:orotidine-5'-phosphate decarboxylase